MRGEPRRLTASPLETTALRIGREAVLNAVKHAAPSVIHVAMEARPARLDRADPGRRRRHVPRCHGAAQARASTWASPACGTGPSARAVPGNRQHARRRDHRHPGPAIPPPSPAGNWWAARWRAQKNAKGEPLCHPFVTLSAAKGPYKPSIEDTGPSPLPLYSQSHPKEELLGRLPHRPRDRPRRPLPPRAGAGKRRHGPVYLAHDLRHDRPVASGSRRVAAGVAPSVPPRGPAGGAPPAPAHPSRLRLRRAGGRLWYTMPYVEGESCGTGWPGGPASTRLSGSRAR